MFNLLMRKLKYNLTKGKIASENIHPEVMEDSEIASDLKTNISMIKAIFGDSDDIVIREFTLCDIKQTKAALVFVDGLTEGLTINQSIIKPLMYHIPDIDSDLQLLKGKPPNNNATRNIEEFAKKRLCIGEIEEVSTYDKVTDGCLNGDSALFIDGYNQSIVINTKGWDKRGVEEPVTEAVVRGPREGFTENIRTNTALIRRKIKHPDLTMQSTVLGRRTRTNVTLAYIKGIANEGLIKDIEKRLKKIDTDAILESGYIEQYIEDAPFSIFPTIGYTEKPDVVAGKILEGRVAIIVDGTPFVITAPFLFLESFQTSEDYNIRPYIATFLRWIRFTSFFISILAPAVYVAFTTYHQELIPTELLFTIAVSREGTPFPAAVEALIMIMAFEILRESGVRLPRPVGQAISIVGALVMGEAAVSAGLIGAPMVIIIAITAVASFAVPTQVDAEVLLRFFFLILAATLGGYGITLGILMMIVHLASLTSFNFYYLQPFAPMNWQDSKDAAVRYPLWAMISRPKGFARKNEIRQRFFVPDGDETNGGQVDEN